MAILLNGIPDAKLTSFASDKKSHKTGHFHDA
jgi:hypothetical protein